MSQSLNSAVAVIGIDIGKNSFHIVGLDERGAIRLRQKWSRGQIDARLANMPPCLIGSPVTAAWRASRRPGTGQQRRARRRGVQSRAQVYVFNVFGWLAEAARG